MTRILFAAAALILTACSDSESTNSAPTATADQAERRSGVLLYRQYCVNCHGSGAAGAPQVGKHNRLYWSHEVEEEGFETLVQEAIHGINAMPPRGNCYDCSDQEIRNAVIYMLQLSAAK
ncbi:cytochrome c5 family protein [Alcanivorax sp. DP30]|uniref:c-type cytochrome n=1 Tax=Alcanivorax sp. DP30 TaxID=2606217 RepID=UPI00136A88CC|nr:c-type cytochrome [Alcanivorax sp. DP30]MZR62807.1 cytochrome c5 family protein [Alcanivorax sp. DP30]